MSPNATSGGRTALVLGSGGVLGGAFHAGVLKALLDCRGLDARDVDVIVGTSAGALTGALLGTGLHPNDIYRRETGQPLSPAGQRLFGRARRQLGEKPAQRSSFGVPASPGLLLRGLLDPLRVSPGTVAAGLLPRGGVAPERIQHLIQMLIDDGGDGVWAWPGTPFIQVCAVDMTTGRRKVFEGTDGETFAEAVAASCAVPGVFSPVNIGGTDYLDGGVHSSDNVDVLAGQSFDLVVVSSPMSTEQLYDVRSPWHPLRVATRVQTEREAARLAPGHIEVVRPGRADLDAMGANMLDGRRRAAVALQAYSTAVAQLSGQPAPATPEAS